MLHVQNFDQEFGFEWLRAHGVEDSTYPRSPRTVRSIIICCLSQRRVPGPPPPPLKHVTAALIAPKHMNLTSSREWPRPGGRDRPIPRGGQWRLHIRRMSCKEHTRSPKPSQIDLHQARPDRTELLRLGCQAILLFPPVSTTRRRAPAIRPGLFEWRSDLDTGAAIPRYSLAHHGIKRWQQGGHDSRQQWWDWTSR